MNFKQLSLSLITTILISTFFICFAKETQSLPNVLVIGDSISIAYTPPLRENLKGKANVFHNPKNARDSKTGLEKLDQWLGDKKWDVIHFNHGLHDMIQGYRNKKDHYVITHKNKELIPIEEYKKNIEAISKRLLKTKAKLFFATTTPLPKNTHYWKGKVGLEKEYNEAAKKIMKRHNIEIIDLYSLLLPNHKELQRRPKDVHYNSKGSKVMADEIAKHIVKVIGRKS